MTSPAWTGVGGTLIIKLVKALTEVTTCIVTVYILCVVLLLELVLGDLSVASVSSESPRFQC